MLAASAAPCPERLEAVTLTGRFIRLEPLDRSHVDDLTEVALSEPNIWTWMPSRAASRADVEQIVDSAIADRGEGLNFPFAVISLESGRAVGSSRYLDYRPAHRGIEIGWTWYAPAVWGSVVNPEAKLLLMRHAFETLGCMRVQLKTDARNLRSRAAIRKLGAQEEGILRKHMLVRGTVIRDSAYFSVVDEEWPAVEAGLQARLASG